MEEGLILLAVHSRRHSGKSSLTCSSSPARSISQRNPSSGMTSDTDTLDTVQLSVRPDPLVGSEIDMTHITNSDNGSAVDAEGISSGYKQLRDTMHICPEGQSQLDFILSGKAPGWVYRRRAEQADLLRRVMKSRMSTVEASTSAEQRKELEVVTRAELAGPQPRVNGYGASTILSECIAANDVICRYAQDVDDTALLQTTSARSMLLTQVSTLPTAALVSYDVKKALGEACLYTKRQDHYLVFPEYGRGSAMVINEERCKTAYGALQLAVAASLVSSTGTVAEQPTVRG